MYISHIAICLPYVFFAIAGTRDVAGTATDMGSWSSEAQKRMIQNWVFSPFSKQFQSLPSFNRIQLFKHFRSPVFGCTCQTREPSLGFFWASVLPCWHRVSVVAGAPWHHWVGVCHLLFSLGFLGACLAEDKKWKRPRACQLHWSLTSIQMSTKTYTPCGDLSFEEYQVSRRSAQGIPTWNLHALHTQTSKQAKGGLDCTYDFCEIVLPLAHSRILKRDEQRCTCRSLYLPDSALADGWDAEMDQNSSQFTNIIDSSFQNKFTIETDDVKSRYCSDVTMSMKLYRWLPSRECHGVGLRNGWIVKPAPFHNIWEWNPKYQEFWMLRKKQCSHAYLYHPISYDILWFHLFRHSHSAAIFDSTMFERISEGIQRFQLLKIRRSCIRRAIFE